MNDPRPDLHQVRCRILRTDDTPPTFALFGEADLYDVPRLTAQLVPHAEAPLTLDLTGLSFMDSTVLGLLIRLARRRLADGDQLTLCVRPFHRRLITQCGLASLFRLEGGLPGE